MARKTTLWLVSYRSHKITMREGHSGNEISVSDAQDSISIWMEHPAVIVRYGKDQMMKPFPQPEEGGQRVVNVIERIYSAIPIKEKLAQKLKL